MWQKLLTSLNRKVNPISRRLGGRKFFLPRTMKEPTVRNSPVGAVFETCTFTAKHAHSPACLWQRSLRWLLFAAQMGANLSDCLMHKHALWTTPNGPCLGCSRMVLATCFCLHQECSRPQAEIYVVALNPAWLDSHIHQPLQCLLAACQWHAQLWLRSVTKPT